jgi:hypothetical protein
VNGYQCLCPTVFSGTNCARLQEQCTGIECLNGGRCISNGTQFVCLCPIGYQGDNCELIIDYCQSQPVRKKRLILFCILKTICFQCQNGGVCSNTELGPQCACTNGISGLFCETIIDQCQSRPCRNNGTCTSLINQYICLCPSGYMGKNERF